MDPERDGGIEHADGDVRVADRQPGDVHGDGDGGHGGDDCGEQCDEPVGHGGDGGQYATVGDREGRERESGGAGGGDVRGGAGERDDHGRQSDDQREWRGDGGELDVERHGGSEHAHRYLDRLERQPRDLQRDGDGRGGRDDCGEQCDESVGHGGDGGQYATVGDREGRERESGGAGGGDVCGGAGERDDHRRQSDHQREWRGDGGELDVERHGGLEHVDGDVRFALREPGHVHGDG